MAKRRHTIRGVVREGALWTLFGGGSFLGTLALIAPVTENQPGILVELVTRLGVSGALICLVWITRQQLVQEIQARSAQVKEMVERHASELAAVNQLRLEESKEFADRLNQISQSGKTDLQRIYGETAAERARFVEAVLTKPQPRPRKGKADGTK